MARVGTLTCSCTGTKIDVDSYSCFKDNAQSSSTELDALLRKRGVTHLLVCGLALDVCVKATALDAVKLGYDVTVDLAATRAAVPSDEPKVLEELRKAGVKLVNSTAPPSTIKDSTKAKEKAATTEKESAKKEADDA